MTTQIAETGRAGRVALIGVGPRGLVVFERLCNTLKNRHSGHKTTIVLIDDTRVGTGRVWRVDQDRALLMNTVASQVTVFTDETVEMRGDSSPGPSLYEWVDWQRKTDPTPGNAVIADEILDLGPEDYPSRVLYGHYLRWAYEHIRERYDDVVQSIEIQDVAAGITVEPAGTYSITLSRRNPIDRLDAVVLTQGHLPLQPNHTPELTRLHDYAAEKLLVYIAPGNAADVDLSVITRTDTVIIRGLGLTFFDYLALLTESRGGQFVRTSDDDPLTYIASGNEPHIVAGSRRGVPHHARGHNQKGVSGRHEPVLLEPDTIEALQRRAINDHDVDFKRDIWPLIAAEVELTYYCTLLAERRSPQEIGELRESYRHIIRGEADNPGAPTDLEELLIRHNVQPYERWNWAELEQPAHDSYGHYLSHKQWIVGLLTDDIRHAKQGNVDGARTAAFDVLRDLRNEIRQIVDYGGVTAESFRRDVEQWYTPLNAFLSIGPPISRVEELHALIRAGIVDIVGPGMRVETRDEKFIVASPRVENVEYTGDAMIEARVPDAHVATARDPLLQGLLKTGMGRPFAHHNPDGSEQLSGGLDVDQHSHAIIGTDGDRQTGVYALGVPTESVRWVTAAGPRPCVNSVTFTDADAIAQGVVDRLITADTRSTIEAAHQ